VASLAISISADKAEYISVRQFVPFMMKVTVLRFPVAHSCRALFKTGVTLWP
jgi:hypothetical protein